VLLKSLPLLALLAVPSLAHEERWQFGLNYHNLESRTWEGITGSTYSQVRPSGGGIDGLGLQLGCRVLDLDRSDISLTAEHQFRTRHTLKVLVARNGQVNGNNPRMWRQSTAPGIQWNAHRALDFGFGLQYRFTRLENGMVSTRNDRPWATAYLGHTFKNPQAVRPYVALRWAVALSQPGRPEGLANPALADAGYEQRLLRYLEGNREVSLQAGVRF
jgi:hypothetical protein